MPDSHLQRFSLAGRVIQDLRFTPIEPPAFAAAIAGRPHRPQYKAGGFFVFSDLPAGQHALLLGGRRFQTRRIEVEVPEITPVPPPLFTLPGEDEVVVRLTGVDAGNRQVTFPPLSLPRQIRAGSPVLTQGAATRLATELEVGEVMMAEVEDTTGLAAGDLMRLVRDDSLRLRHDPYSVAPEGLDRLVGRVHEVADPEAGIPEVAVRVTTINGAPVLLTEVAGAQVATVEVEGEPDPRILGSGEDLATRTNARGDYNLYFPSAAALTELGLEVSRPGFGTLNEIVETGPGKRTKRDFPLGRD